jgi:uncharacterized protein YndB with AHSA1/START domain
MITLDATDDHGRLTEPTTLEIRRLLPGPIERCWAHLTDGELRRRWLAAGDMTLTVGAPFEFVWRNDELTDPPGRRPDGFAAEHRMTGEILAVEPPTLLTFSWPGVGEVTFRLEPAGDRVLLTLVHRRLPDHPTTLSVSAGWHMHLDLLVARLEGRTPPPFWDGWAALRADYEDRIPL